MSKDGEMIGISANNRRSDSSIMSRDEPDKAKIATLENQLKFVKRELRTEEVAIALLIAAGHVSDDKVKMARELAEAE